MDDSLNRAKAPDLHLKLKSKDQCGFTIQLSPINRQGSGRKPKTNYLFGDLDQIFKRAKCQPSLL